MNREDVIKIIPDDQKMFLELTVAYQFYDYLMKLPEEGRMIEIGTGMGHATVFYNKVKPKWIIYTIDGYGLFGEKSIYPYDLIDGKRICSSHDLLVNLRNFEEAGNKVIQIVQNSKKVPWELPVDLIYIDGDHTYEGCRADFERYSPFLKTPGYIFFHDYWREDFGVKQLVDEICEKDWRLLVAGNAAIVERK
jgi:hypothetical protein